MSAAAVRSRRARRDRTAALALWNEGQVLRNHRRRRLEERRDTVGIDRRRAVAREERRQLVLRSDRKRGSRGIRDVREELVRVLRYCRIRGEREIVPEQRRQMGAAAGA